MSRKNLGRNQLDPLSLRRLSRVVVYRPSFDNRLGNRCLRRDLLSLSLIILCPGVRKERQENENCEKRILQGEFL